MIERIKVTKISDRIYLMDDAGEATGYLLVGDEKVMVIDTMNGYEDINEVAKEITDLPLVVVNTHGHPDHILGNVYFKEAYMHEDDFAIAEMFTNDPELQENMRREGVSMPPFKPLNDGDVFDLGGITAQMVLLPGHTKGGICVLCPEERAFFTGDALNCHCWMMLDHSLPLKDLKASLEKISWVKEKADVILHGHARDTEPISLFDEFYNGVCDLLEHPESAETDPDYDWFGGICKQHVFGEGKVIVYGVDKL